MFDDPQGRYDSARIVDSGLDVNRVTIVPVAGANHYTVLLAEPGVRVVAEQIKALAAHPAEQ